MPKYFMSGTKHEAYERMMMSSSRRVEEQDESSRKKSNTNLEALLGRQISEDDYENIRHIYAMIAGDMGDWTYDGDYSFIGGDYSTELDVPAVAADPNKTAEGLVAYVTHAYESGWGYVWGTFGNVLTAEVFASKLAQYPDGVGNYEDFIRENWIGRRTADCVGLIKSYGWYDPETQSIQYGSHGMPDLGANQMYYTASESGTIDTIPEIPGLAVWHDGHIGVYIGNGEVIEAMGTKYGVVKTQLAGRGWTHWLKIAFLLFTFHFLLFIFYPPVSNFILPLQKLLVPPIDGANAPHLVATWGAYRMGLFQKFPKNFSGGIDGSLY